jgi:DNA-binding NtrC family response regulator
MVLVYERLHVLQTGVTAIGRGVPASEGIGIPEDSWASRVHAHLHVTTPRPDAAPLLRIVDAQSKNGTFVNGARVAQRGLLDGDLIRVGDSFFVLRFEDLPHDDCGPGLLQGRAPAMRVLRYQLACAAASSASVLVLGQSGTGKELAARTLHEHRRAGGRLGPFIGLNCAAIPQTLAESQLFGHVAGAFSDAKTASEGFFRAAHGGTLFLDEVGELPAGLQAKLLRALEEKAVIPVGATRAIPCDIRLVAATNRDLLEGVLCGSFRGDLYARLAALPIELPPLSARREDILPLLLHFYSGPPPRLSARLAESLLLHSWPFNVRELAQLTEHLRVQAQNQAELDLPLVERRLRPVLPAGNPEPPSGRGAQAGTPGSSSQRLPPPLMHPPLPKDALLRLLTEHAGVISKVARAVGRSRKQVHRWLLHYSIDPHKLGAALDHSGKVLVP